MSFVAGLFAGVAVTVLAGFFVFRASAVAGQSSGLRVDLRALVALAALVLAVIAFVRSGDSHSHSDARGAPGVATTATTAPSQTDPPVPTAPLPTAQPTTTTTTRRVIVTVPNVVGLAQVEAIARLHAKGLQVRVQTLPLNNITPGFVISQTPGAFTTTTTNAIVFLSVSARV